MRRGLVDLYRGWEEETREASCRGVEGLLPPVSEWPSFLDAPLETPEEFPFAAAAEPAVESAGAAADTPGGQGKEAGSPQAADPGQELPEPRLPENLQAEIEDFLKRDRSAPASEDEVASFLKGGFDPNVEPEE